MKPAIFVGKTLAEIAQQTSVFWKAVRVFLHKDATDPCGTRLMESFSVRQFLIAYPNLASATVFAASDFYGELILRILPVKEEHYE